MAQLVECSPSLAGTKLSGSSPALRMSDVGVHACSLSTPKWKAGGSEVQGRPQVHNTFHPA